VTLNVANSDNVDRFNKIASEAFAMLYESIPLTFDPTDFDIPNEHGEVQKADWDFVVAAIDWLE
jgi:hypothetical protein